MHAKQLVLQLGCAEGSAVRATAWAIVGVLAGWVALNASPSSKRLFIWIAVFSSVVALTLFGVSLTGGAVLLQPWFRWVGPVALAIVGFASYFHLRSAIAPQSRVLLATFHCIVWLALLLLGTYFHGAFAGLHDVGPVGISVTSLL